MQTSARLHGQRITLHNAVAIADFATAPSGASAGGAVAGAEVLAGFTAESPRDAELTIDSSGTGTLLGPVVACAQDGTDDDKWRQIAVLNDGRDIQLTAALGYGQKLRDVLRFKRMAIFARGGTSGSGNLTVKLLPHETSH